jgi:hypothetical protein
MLLEEIKQNRIFAGLPSTELDLVLPLCELVDLQLGDILNEANEPVRFLHFPIDTALSMTAMEDPEHMVEATLTGREGSSGSSVIQGGNRSTCVVMVQIPGTAVRVATPALIAYIPRLPYLTAALSRHNLLLMRHAVISVGCCGFHHAPQRVARWLKAHWHRTGIDSFPFSDQFLAAQAGVAPEVVAEVLKDLERNNIIRTAHNKVMIVDNDALTQRACKCFTLDKEATEEYLEALTELARIYGTP